MQNIFTIFLVSLIPALFFGDPRDWWKSDNEKEYDKKELGGGKFAWFAIKLGSVMSWFYILIVLYIVFVIIKSLWKLA